MKKKNTVKRDELNVAYKRLLKYIKLNDAYKYSKEEVGSIRYYVGLYCSHLKIKAPKVKSGLFMVKEYNRKGSPIYRGISLPPYNGKSLHRKKYDKYLGTDKWKLFKIGIIEKRGAKCERCGFVNNYLDLHHKTYERLFDELPEDVELLCKTCHRKEHKLI